MIQNHDPLSKLIFELSKLPGIGEKTATRLAYYVIKQDSSFAQNLADALLNAKKAIHLCPQCLTFTDIQPCRICADSSRDSRQICVVERPSDVLSIERSRSFKGTYHVLHGVLSPLEGIGPDDLKIRELLSRMPVEEVILATNPSVEGDATAYYISRLLKTVGIRTTRLAHGMPVGGALEYTDQQTIHKAFENRIEVRL